MHDGTIQAYSEGEGKGAEFTVTVPIATDLLNESSFSSARRVLVVDDNPDHLQLLADLLRMRGYEVVEAHNATEALTLIARTSPTLAL
jgi:PleD family two-component response regulator